jgi:hypothetical protein
MYECHRFVMAGEEIGQSVVEQSDDQSGARNVG